VNLGFTNAWFNNGNEFSSIIGTTNGNQGSPVPFQVANALDTSGQGGNNNFWFGLWGGPGNQLFGSPLSVTIPINLAGVTTVYTLADNTYGCPGCEEFDSITFTQVNGVDGAILAGVTVQTTPEQASVLLLGTCLAAVAFLMRRRLVR
jgi:hypothetical protein